MTIKDAFALALDKAIATKNDSGKVVHLSFKFKVDQHKRGEQGGDNEDDANKKDAADEITADSMPSIRGLLLDAISSHSSIAMDRAPVKTPLSECKAKNPMRCKYHGQAAMTKKVNELLSDCGVTPVKPISISKLDDLGSFQLDMDVAEADVAKAKDAVAKFGKMDGILMDDEFIESDKGKIEALYEIDELDPDDEFEDEDDDSDEDAVSPTEAKAEASVTPEPKKEEPKDDTAPSPKADFEKDTIPPTTTEPPRAVETPKTDEPSPSPTTEPAHKKVDAVAMLLEASKRITGAAKSVNRGIDRGTFSPRDSRLVAAEKMRGPLEAMAKAEGLPGEFRDRASALVASLDAIKASKEGGFKERVGDVPYFDEDHFRAIGEAAGMKLAPKEEKVAPPKPTASSSEATPSSIPTPAPEAPKDEFVPPKSVAEGVMKMDELKKSSDYLDGLLSKPDEMSASLAADLKDELKKDKDLLDRYTKATDELRAKDEAEEKARKEAEKKAAEEAKKPEDDEEETTTPSSDATKPAKKPRAKKGIVATETKLVLGKSTTVLDGYTGKDINKARVAAGLAPLEALKHIDTKVKTKTENFRLATKKMAEEYGDPELDISDPEVFETVQKNWAETVKSIANEGQFCSFCEPNDVLSFLLDGHYRTHLSRGRLANLSHCYGTSKAHSDEAAISSILCPSDSDRKFGTHCCDRFGPLCIEWRKDGNLVPCFSNCDADEPANQDRAKGGDYVYNTSLISNPSICSLAAFCKGLDSIKDATGYTSPTGKKETSWMNALKVLRKGPIKGDAKDFDTIVNGEDKWKPGLDLYGWNEAPLLGHGTTKDVGAIHLNSKKWESMRSSAWSHGSKSYATARDFVEALKKIRGSILKENGIKIILDGAEVPLD